MERRSFLQILVGAASAPTLSIAKIAENPPPLPIPRHPEIPIRRALHVAFGDIGGSSFRGDSFREAFQLGRSVCQHWRLNEHGLFVNAEPIIRPGSVSRYITSYRFRVSACLINDPDHPWLTAMGKVRHCHPINSFDGSDYIFDVGELVIEPESFTELDVGPKTLWEACVKFADPVKLVQEEKRKLSLNLGSPRPRPSVMEEYAKFRKPPHNLPAQEALQRARANR